MYDEEYYYEPSQADMIMAEYQEKLKEALKDSVKNYIENVKKENEKLKKDNEKLQKLVAEIEDKERELEYQKSNLMREVRRERLSILLEDFQVIMYKVGNAYKEQPKCNKCNDKRKIVFISPLGNTFSESCTCAERLSYYIPEEQIATEFKIDNYFNKDKLIVWYKNHKEKNSDDYCSYSSSSVIKTIYEPNLRFEEIEKRDMFFRSKEDCQKYCDWLNENKKV